MSPRNFKTSFSVSIRRIIGYSLIALCFVVVSGLFFVEEDVSTHSFQTLTATMSAPVTVSAKAWGIFDLETGEVRSGINTKESYPIASVTKLFVAESVLRSSRKDEILTITFSDLATEGRAGKLTYGEQVTPYTLLFPLLLESSNDAGEAVKRFLGTDFENAVTDIRSSLSLNGTRITDASGLSAENTSSVHDLAVFYTYLKKTHPHILDITKLHTYIGPKNGYINNDPARTLVNFTGGKHGYTPLAGRTFVGSFVVPNTQEEIGIVLLGSSDLVADIEKLLTYRSSEEVSDIMTQ